MDTRHSPITIRSVREEDLDALADVEKNVWSQLETPILSRYDLQEWYNDHSPFFLVAEARGEICGYYFGKIIQFSLEKIDEFLDPSLMTGLGHSNHAHISNGSCLYGINIVSLQPGTGRALYAAVHTILEKMRLPYSVGITRLSGFDAYMNDIESNHGEALPYSMDEIATWYAYESARILGMKIWPSPPAQRPMQDFILPALAAPDPVLAFHVRGTTFGLLRIVPDYIVPDSQSRNYGACFASVFPHR